MITDGAAYLNNPNLKEGVATHNSLQCDKWVENPNKPMDEDRSMIEE